MPLRKPVNAGGMKLRSQFGRSIDSPSTRLLEANQLANAVQFDRTYQSLGKYPDPRDVLRLTQREVRNPNASDYTIMRALTLEVEARKDFHGFDVDQSADHAIDYATRILDEAAKRSPTESNRNLFLSTAGGIKKFLDEQQISFTNADTEEKYGQLLNKINDVHGHAVYENKYVPSLASALKNGPSITKPQPAEHASPDLRSDLVLQAENARQMDQFRASIDSSRNRAEDEYQSKFLEDQFEHPNASGYTIAQAIDLYIEKQANDLGYSQDQKERYAISFTENLMRSNSASTNSSVEGPQRAAIASGVVKYFSEKVPSFSQDDLGTMRNAFSTLMRDANSAVMPGPGDHSSHLITNAEHPAVRLAQLDEFEKVKRATTQPQRIKRVLGLGKTATSVINDAVASEHATPESVAAALLHRNKVSHRRSEIRSVPKRLRQLSRSTITGVMDTFGNRTPGTEKQGNSINVEQSTTEKLRDNAHSRAMESAMAAAGSDLGKRDLVLKAKNLLNEKYRSRDASVTSLERSLNERNSRTRGGHGR